MTNRTHATIGGRGPGAKMHVKRLCAVTSLTVWAVAFGSCGGPSTAPSGHIRSIDIAGIPSQSRVGMTWQFSATITLSNGSVLTVTSGATWQSSSSSILTVSNTGLAQAVAAGTVTVSVNYQGVMSRTVIDVVKCHLTWALSGQETLGLGESVLWQASGYSPCGHGTIPAPALWQSLNPDVVSVVSTNPSFGSGTAKITGLTPGTATILATFDGTESRGTVVVLSTRAAPPTRVRTDVLAALPVGQTNYSRAIAEYEDQRTKDVTALAEWSSSNPAVAATSNGSVTAVSPGTTDIRVVYDGVGATQRLTVIGIDVDAIAASSVTMGPAGGQTADGFYVSVIAAYVLASAPAGRIVVELRDQDLKILRDPRTDPLGEFVPRGSGLRGAGASVDVPTTVTTICATLSLRPDGGTPVSVSLGCAPAHPQN